MSGQAYEQLTLFPADSHASPSPWLESKRAKGMIDTSGRRCSELSQSCARVALSVRTFLESSRLPPGRWSRIWSVLAIHVVVFNFEAAAVGAWHRRSRVFFTGIADVADTDGGWLHDSIRKEDQPARSRGNDIYEQSGRTWGGQQSAGARVSPDERAVADAACERIQRHAAICAAEQEKGSGEMQSDAESGNEAVYDAMRSGCAGDARWGKSQELADGRCWAAEPDVGRVAHGIPARVDRLKCLGNAVVPQQAYPLFKALMEELDRWT